MFDRSLFSPFNVLCLDKKAVPAEAGLPVPLLATDLDVAAVGGTVQRVNRHAVTVFAGEGVREGQVLPLLTILGDENRGLGNPFVPVGTTLHRHGVKVTWVRAELYDDMVGIVSIGLLQVRYPRGSASCLFGIESAGELRVALFNGRKREGVAEEAFESTDVGASEGRELHESQTHRDEFLIVQYDLLLSNILGRSMGKNTATWCKEQLLATH